MEPKLFQCWDYHLRPLQLWEWTYATLLIKNDWAEDCTGFLVGRHVSDVGEYKIFLVSNKHALPSELDLREQTDEITLHCNVREPNGTTVGTAPTLPLHFADGSRIWKEHPDRDVDVMAFDVTHLITGIPRIRWRFARYADFADKENLDEWDIRLQTIFSL